MQGYKNSKIANIQSTLLVIMHLSICTPTPPPRDYVGQQWGIYLSFDNTLVPRGGVFDSRTNACYVSPISSLRSIPDSWSPSYSQCSPSSARKQESARVAIVYRSVLATGHGGACL